MESVSYSYANSKVEVLKQINFEIFEGDYISIIGKSGSGKSTLLSILGLLNFPESGKYTLFGSEVHNLTKGSIAKLKNRAMGFVFQNFNIINRLSIFDNVCLPLIYSDIPRSKYRERVECALNEVGMLDYIDRYPSQLSGGQLQRVAIARATVNRPAIIFADEPTGNLDSHNSKQIFKLLDELNQRGTTICLITHDESFAQQAKRQWKMSDGKLTTDISSVDGLHAFQVAN